MTPVKPELGVGGGGFDADVNGSVILDIDIEQAARDKQHLPALACYITAAGTIDCLVNTTLLSSAQSLAVALFNSSVNGNTHTHTEPGGH